MCRADAGPLNLFQFKKFQVVVDYAHNPHGFEALGKFLSKIPDSPKVGVIAGVGDRRDEDTVNLGRLSAQMFDEIIIRQDRNLRGKTDDEIIALMVKGIKEIDPNKPVNIIKKEDEAIRHAISNAKPGSFLTLCSDVVPDALALVLKLKEEDEKVSFNKDDIPRTGTRSWWGRSVLRTPITCYVSFDLACPDRCNGDHAHRHVRGRS